MFSSGGRPFSRILLSLLSVSVFAWMVGVRIRIRVRVPG